MTADELKKYCEEEFGHIDRIVTELFRVYVPDKDEYTLDEKAAITVYLANIYSGCEKILKQMLEFDKLDISDSPSWHEKVLKKSGEIGILPPDLLQVFSQYLAFRNFFVYNYIFSIQWDGTKVLIDASRDVVGRFRTEVDEYIQTV